MSKRLTTLKVPDVFIAQKSVYAITKKNCFILEEETHSYKIKLMLTIHKRNVMYYKGLVSGSGVGCGGGSRRVVGSSCLSSGS